MPAGDLMTGRNRYYCKDIETERGTMAFRCGRRVIFVRRLARRDGRLFGSRMKSGHAPTPPTPPEMTHCRSHGFLPVSRRHLSTGQVHPSGQWVILLVIERTNHPFS